MSPIRIFVSCYAFIGGNGVQAPVHARAHARTHALQTIAHVQTLPNIKTDRDESDYSMSVSLIFDCVNSNVCYVKALKG